MSLPLFVNETQISQDRHGNYSVDEFCMALFEENQRKGWRAEQLTSELYISDVTDFLKTIATKMGESLAALSACLRWGDESGFRLGRRRGQKRAPAPAQLSNDDDENDDGDDEEEDVGVGVERANSPRTPLRRTRHRVHTPSAPFKRKARQHASLLKVNSKALASLGPLCADTGEFGRLARSAAMPYIEALRKAGPVRLDAAPENPNSPLLSVSQRLRQLGEDPIGYNSSEIGKRSLELYRECFPGHNPPQRLGSDWNNRQYMMNVYTPEICLLTIDVAVAEANE